MTDNGEDQIDEAGRNPTQQRMDEELAREGNAPIGVEFPPMREDMDMSEVIPEDEDRGGDDAAIGEEGTEENEEEAEETA
jgi:hypothetical protein